MASSLKRVLRIRALREDLSRMELEAEAARLRHIDLAATEAASEARISVPSPRPRTISVACAASGDSSSLAQGC